MIKLQLNSIICGFFLVICTLNAKAQCSPPMGETCSESQVICSLNALNGYTCSNTSTIPSLCSPLCSEGGMGHNTSWLGFTTLGGSTSISINVSSCSNAQGLLFGIWGDCVCGQEIGCHSNPCIPSGGTATITANLISCKTYFLWVDGCNGDVCNFTINTSGGGTPSLSPLGFINNVPSKIIQPICVGACDVLFYINDQPGGCQPTYVWTLDGNEIGGNSSQIHLDFPDEGDFIICVTAYIGNPESGSICSQQGPQCATIKSRSISDKTGLPRKLCHEQASNGGYKWHSQKILYSGIYREQFSDGNCCRFDSVVEFTVLDIPQPENVYYISCDNEPYIDILGVKHNPCLDHSKIMLSKTTDPYKCDSSILLTAVKVDFMPTWSSRCYNGMVELIPNIHIQKPCEAGESYEFEYKWYLKKDPSQILGTDQTLMVATVSEDYCLQVIVRTELQTESAICEKTFCESIDEGNITPECFPLIGSKIFCFDSIANYRIDTILSKKVNSYTWTIQGGQFISKTDTSAVKVKWSLGPTDSGKICASYNTDCGTSCEKCITVLYQKNIAGPNFEKRGLDAYLTALPNPNGRWKLISGSYGVDIIDPSDARTRVTAHYYGYYCFEWSIQSPNCTLRDTQCVNFYYKQLTNPEYPKNIFDFRNSNSKQNNTNPIEPFTPNLISANGSSFMEIQNETNLPIHYSWYDIYGKLIFNRQTNAEAGIQRIEINSPRQQGFYFLLLDLNGISIVKKVCVME